MGVQFAKIPRATLRLGPGALRARRGQPFPNQEISFEQTNFSLGNEGTNYIRLPLLEIKTVYSAFPLEVEERPRGKL